jgi:lysophospholipase L1-like esterase
MKIVFLGDSLTWGGYGGNFVPHVAAQLPDHEIVNAGIGGDTVLNLLRRVEYVLETETPDAVFTMVGGNDAVSYSMPRTRPYYRRAKGIKDGIVTPEHFTSAYRELLSQIQLAFAQPLVGLPPTEYSRELIEIRKQFSARAQQVADRMNVPVLDLCETFTPDEPIERDPVDLRFIQVIGERSGTDWADYEAERQKWGYTYTFDGMHLMPAAAEQMADIIAAFLHEQLDL